MSFHRGRIRIDILGDASQYLTRFTGPAGSECLGIVQVGAAEPGALIYVESTGEYWQIDLQGQTRLMTRKVQAALSALGKSGQNQESSGPQASDTPFNGQNG